MGDFCGWYRREDYDRIREIMDDGDKFPRTFDEWEKRAKSQKASAAAGGIALVPVIIDPEKFVAFCQRQNLPKGSATRGMFVVEVGSTVDKH